MALEYGITNAGGSGSTNFWKLIGGGVNDIELDPVSGATGISATLPSHPDLGLVLTDNNPYDGGPGAGVTFVDFISGFQGFSGIRTAAPTYGVSQELQNIATGETIFAAITPANMTLQLGSRGTVNDYSLNIGLDLMAWANNGLTLFQVDTLGGIGSNQISGPSSGANSWKHCLPINYIGGLLAGYIPIYETPNFRISGVAHMVLSTGAGTGATGSFTGDDLKGLVTFTAGTAPVTGGLIFQINFGNLWTGGQLFVFLSPINSAASALAGFYSFTDSHSQFNVHSGNPLIPGTTYQLNYQILSS